MSLPTRAIAVDWSGAVKGSTKKIWLAKVDSAGLSVLKNGMSREIVCSKIIDELDCDSELVVGFDFAFSFPYWFVRSKGCSGAHDFWRVVERQGENWLQDIEEPFFETGTWNDEERQAYRLTDRYQKERGWHPETVFKLVGPRQVGKGSIRGMPQLRRLKEAGFNIWPFDPPRLPLVVEIFPRLFYGDVNKSSHDARYSHLARNYPQLEERQRCKAAASDDAFDATVSAFEMFTRRSEFESLPETVSEMMRVEGWIWGSSVGPSNIS